MSSLFPGDITLEECRAAIAAQREFTEKFQDDLIIFNYKFCTKNTFPDPASADSPEQARLLSVRRECRGLVFSAETGRVTARRYHKFFNVGELPECSEAHVDLRRPHVILEKFDGSLVTPVRTRGQIKFASKNGVENITKLIEARYMDGSESCRRLVAFCERWMSDDYTPIFEYCSPRNKIVLHYPNDQLVLTSIRHNATGDYVLYPRMQQSAEEYGVAVTSAWSGTHGGLADMMSKFKAQELVEGFVIRFDDGRMYKVKTDWYFERAHKQQQDFPLASERSVWQLVLSQQVDDVLASTGDERFNSRVRDFEVQLYDALCSTATRLADAARDLRERFPEKRDYMQNMQRTQPQETFNILIKLYDSTADAQDVLTSVISLMIAKNLEKARALLGGVAFVE